MWSVRYLLGNPVYAGYVQWDKLMRRGDHEPLIPMNLFLRVLDGFLVRARTEEKRQAIEALREALQLEEEGETILLRGVAEHAV